MPLTDAFLHEAVALQGTASRCPASSALRTGRLRRLPALTLQVAGPTLSHVLLSAPARFRFYIVGHLTSRGLPVTRSVASLLLK